MYQYICLNYLFNVLLILFFTFADNMAYVRNIFRRRKAIKTDEAL